MALGTFSLGVGKGMLAALQPVDSLAWYILSVLHHACHVLSHRTPDSQVFDDAFFVLISVVMLSIVAGIIIDAFGASRDQKNFVNIDQKNKCFVCGCVVSHSCPTVASYLSCCYVLIDWNPPSLRGTPGDSSTIIASA